MPVYKTLCAGMQMMLYKNYLNAAHVRQMDQPSASLDEDMDERAMKSRNVKFHNHISKWLTVVIMLLLTMALSPKFFQRELGKVKFGSYGQFCNRDADFESKIEDMLKGIALYDTATSLTSDAELMDYWASEMLSSTIVQFSATDNRQERLVCFTSHKANTIITFSQVSGSRIL